MDGFEAAGRLLGVFELRQRASHARRLAAELEDRGGGFTAHAAALARQSADHYEQRAQWAEQNVTKDPDNPFHA